MQAECWGVCVVTCAPADRDHSSTKAHSVQHISAFFTKRTTLCTASQQSCAYGSHCRPNTNQYAIQRTPQACYPTRQLWPSCLETACHAAPSCLFIAWLKLLSLAMMSLHSQHASRFDMSVLYCSSLFRVAHILGLVASKCTHTANCT